MRKGLTIHCGSWGLSCCLLSRAGGNRICVPNFRKMGCSAAFFTHVQSCDVTRVQSATEWTASVHFTHVQSCDVTRVQSATEWTASVHTSRVSKSCDVTCVQMLAVSVDCFGTYFAHVQSCDVTGVQSGMECCFGTYLTHVQSCDV